MLERLGTNPGVIRRNLKTVLFQLISDQGVVMRGRFIHIQDGHDIDQLPKPLFPLFPQY